MNPLTPSPRDWTEDFADEDNGAYSHTCPTCKLDFTAHKRRVGECRVCAGINEAEAKRRAEWLNERGAPLDWVILTSGEVAAIKTDLLDLVWEKAQLTRLLTEAADWIDPKRSPPDKAPSQMAKHLRDELAKARKPARPESP